MSTVPELILLLHQKWHTVIRTQQEQDAEGMVRAAHSFSLLAFCCLRSILHFLIKNFLSRLQWRTFPNRLLYSFCWSVVMGKALAETGLIGSVYSAASCMSNVTALGCSRRQNLFLPEGIVRIPTFHCSNCNLRTGHAGKHITDISNEENKQVAADKA